MSEQPSKINYAVHRAGLTESAVTDIFAARIGRVTPSGVFALFDRTGIVYSAGLGECNRRRPTLDTAYRIASCTKSFTAAALMIMVERGMLALHDPIDSYVSTGPLIGPDGHPVPAPTLGQLASMAGGMPKDDPWADRQESLTPEEFAAVLRPGIRFIASPGVRFEYSNLGYALLGAAIERVAGRDFVTVVTEEILEPLKLTGIGFDAGVAAPDGIAVGYRRLDRAWEALPFSGPGAFSPIGGAFATARALCDWAQWLAAAFDAGADHGPVSAPDRRRMQTAQTPVHQALWGPAGSRGYGYGLLVEDHPRHGRIVCHSGGYPGFGAHMRWHPDSGLGIVALENATYASPADAAIEALQLILDDTVLPAAEPQLWPETAAARLTVERLFRSWDDTVAAELFSANVDADEPLDRRRRQLAEIATAIEPDPDPAPLIDCSPASRHPAHLAWTVAGGHGSARCEITLTPQHPPKVQTLTVHRH